MHRKGLNDDGKRNAIEHHEDYTALVADDTPTNRLRRLETLNIFSLKKSYLDVFLKALEDDLPAWIVQRSVLVKPSVVRLGKKKEASFEHCRDKLKAFKVGRNVDEPTLIAVRSASGRRDWRYLADRHNRLVEAGREREGQDCPQRPTEKAGAGAYQPS